ncbi:MAG: glycosyltransferase, partial [Azospirillum sp.]|nr:glycosyltransferase [Azospirillum sp.]
MAKILIHVQHLLGTGHTRRMAAIAKALAARGHETTLASGGLPLPLD